MQLEGHCDVVALSPVRSHTNDIVRMATASCLINARRGWKRCESCVPRKCGGGSGQPVDQIPALSFEDGDVDFEGGHGFVQILHARLQHVEAMLDRGEASVDGRLKGHETAVDRSEPTVIQKQGVITTSPDELAPINAMRTSVSMPSSPLCAGSALRQLLLARDKLIQHFARVL